MGRGSHSLSKRRREAEKQRKKREKRERKRQRQEDSSGVEIASVEDLQPEAVNATVEGVLASGRTVIAGEEQLEPGTSGPPVRLFVGGLSFDTTSDSLRTAFEAAGTVVDATIVHDRDTGDPRGFGFVTMGDRKAASKALKELGGMELDGRNIRVDVATER